MTAGRSMRVRAAGGNAAAGRGSLRIRAAGQQSAPRPTVPAATFGRSMVIRILGCLCDTFDRTVVAGWGTGPLGTWTEGHFEPPLDPPFARPSWSTDGSAGIVTTATWNEWDWQEMSGGLWTDHAAWTMTARMKASQWKRTGSTGAVFQFLYVAADWPRTLPLPAEGADILTIGYEHITEHKSYLSFGYTDVYLDDELQPDAWYAVEWEYELGGTTRARIYPYGTPAPDWQAVWDGSGVDPDYPRVADMAGTHFAVAARQSDTTFTVDTICICV